MASYPKAVSLPILGNMAEICIVSPDVYDTIDSFAKLDIRPFQIFDFNSSTIRTKKYMVKHAQTCSPEGRSREQKSLVIEIMRPTGGKSLMQKLTRMRTEGGRVSSTLPGTWVKICPWTKGRKE